MCSLGTGGAQQHMQQRRVQSGGRRAQRQELLQCSGLVDHRLLLLRALSLPAQGLPLPVVRAMRPTKKEAFYPLVLLLFTATKQMLGVASV